MILPFISPRACVFQHYSGYNPGSMSSSPHSRLVVTMFVCVNVYYVCVNCMHNQTQKQGSWSINTCCCFKGNSLTDPTVTNLQLPHQSLSPREKSSRLCILCDKIHLLGNGLLSTILLQLSASARTKLLHPSRPHPMAHESDYHRDSLVLDPISIWYGCAPSMGQA